MMKNMQRSQVILLASALISATFVLSGCGSKATPSADGSNAATNSSQGLSANTTSTSDFNSYVTDVGALSSRESDILARYDSVSGDNYTDDATMYDVLVALVPDIRSFTTDLETIQPSDPALLELHNKYIQGWNDQYNGMTKIIGALENQDYSAMADANQLLASGRALIREYTTGLGALVTASQ